MKMATRRRSAGSTAQLSTATPSSPSWPSSRPWATCRLTLPTPSVRCVHLLHPSPLPVSEAFKACLVLGSLRVHQPQPCSRIFPSPDSQRGVCSVTCLTALTSVPRMMPGSCLHCPVLLRSKACFLKTCPASSGGSGLTMVCKPALAAHGNTSSMTQPLSEYCKGPGMAGGPRVLKLMSVH